MIIKNACVLGDNFKFEKSDVLVEGDLIAGIGESVHDSYSNNVIDGEGLLLLPGLIDSHTHGCVGFDTCDKNTDGYKEMSHFYASHGVTSFLFTTMTIPFSNLKNTVCAISEYIDTDVGNSSYAHGIYLEGPFINPVKKGAQNEEYVLPPNKGMVDELKRLSGGKIRIVSVAPEVNGGIEFIEKASKDYIITLAHTECDYNTAIKAIESGALSITHVFNAMPSFLHRNPGVIGASFDSNIFIEMICDGIHIHPCVIRTIFKVCDKDRIVLISDSMSASGMEDGTYSLGGQKVTLKGNRATLSDGTIAGSASNLMDCVKNCVDFGIPIEDAVKAATINPAKRLNLDGLVGSIKTGKRADLILTDKNLNLKKIIIKGKMFNK